MESGSEIGMDVGMDGVAVPSKAGKRVCSVGAITSEYGALYDTIVCRMFVLALDALSLAAENTLHEAKAQAQGCPWRSTR